METLLPVLLSIIFIFFMIGVFFTWFFIHKAKTKERMALIEKQLDPTLFFEKKTEKNFPWLKTGIVLLFSGPGFVIGSDHHSIGIALGFALAFGGAGMIVANFFDREKKQQ
jgi:hypothetical protein